MTYYNLTLLENVTSPEIVLTAANDYTGGYLGSLLLLTAFVLLFTYWSRRGEDIDTNIVYSSFITSILAVLFFAIGFIDWRVSMIPIIIMFLSFMINKFR